MDEIKQLREYTRLLERKLNYLNAEDCCVNNINTIQCHILVEVGRNPTISLKQVAEIVKIDKSAACKMVDGLVKQNLMTRKQAEEDRRWIQLNLTADGEQVFQNIEEDMNRKFLRLYEEIPEKERETVLQSLKLYLDAFDQVQF